MRRSLSPSHPPPTAYCSAPPPRATSLGSCLFSVNASQRATCQAADYPPARWCIKIKARFPRDLVDLRQLLDECNQCHLAVTQLAELVSKLPPSNVQSPSAVALYGRQMFQGQLLPFPIRNSKNICHCINRVLAPSYVAHLLLRANDVFDCRFQQSGSTGFCVCC